MRTIWQKFRQNDRGNIAILAGFAMIPMFVLGGGAIEFAEGLRLRSQLLIAADSAVLGAFAHKSDDWRETQKVAHRLFKSNINNPKRYEKLKMKLKREIRDKKFVYTYTVKAKTVPIMGDLNPFPLGDINVASSAQFDPRKGKRPRLISPNRKGVDR